MCYQVTVTQSARQCVLIMIGIWNGELVNSLRCGQTNENSMHCGAVLRSGSVMFWASAVGTRVLRGRYKRKQYMQAAVHRRCALPACNYMDGRFLRCQAGRQGSRRSSKLARTFFKIKSRIHKVLNKVYL